MSDSVRLEDLRRRIEKDPASIAFAQLAEEYRRLGQHQEAIDTCRRGLARHPGYLSARVTLGRSLLYLGQLDEAQQELETVLQGAPQNLAAIRAMGDIYRRRDDIPRAMTQYQSALQLAPNDPELERAIAELHDTLTRTSNERENVRLRAHIAELEKWLAAIHVTRAQRSA
jgi:tetratricopeptide (TPR) repeat protein